MSRPKDLQTTYELTDAHLQWRRERVVTDKVRPRCHYINTFVVAVFAWFYLGRYTALPKTNENYSPITFLMVSLTCHFRTVKSPYVGDEKIPQIASQQPDHDHNLPHRRWPNSGCASKCVLKFKQSNSPSLVIISNVCDTTTGNKLTEEICKKMNFSCNEDIPHLRLYSQTATDIYFVVLSLSYYALFWSCTKLYVEYSIGLLYSNVSDQTIRPPVQNKYIPKSESFVQRTKGI